MITTYKGQQGTSGSNVGYIGIDCVCGVKFGYELKSIDSPSGVVTSEMQCECGRLHVVTVFAMSTVEPINNREGDEVDAG